MRSLFYKGNAVLTAAAVLIPALAIGATTAIFTLLNAFFLRPVPGVVEPARVTWIYNTDEHKGGPLGSYLTLSYPDCLDYRDRNEVFSDVAVFQHMLLNMSTDSDAEQLRTYVVSANYFDLLGVEAYVGRTFLPEDDTRPVVVLSHALWSSKFGADPDVVGRTVRLNRQPFTVIGVAAPGFLGIRIIGTNQIWIPLGTFGQLATPEEAEMLQQRGGRILNMIGRLKPGIEVRQAEAGMQTLARELAEQYPETNQGLGVALLPLPEVRTTPAQIDKEKRAALVLGAGGLAVLLMACFSLTNVLLARAAGLQGSFTDRRRSRIENLLLAVVGVVVALAATKQVARLLWSFRPPYLRADALDFSPAPAVLLFSFVVLLTISAVAGRRPDSKAARPRTRNLLVALQVVVCLACLIGAGWFFRSLRDGRGIDMGFRQDRLLFSTLRLNGAGYDELQARDFVRQLLDRLEQRPEVESATLGENPPLYFLGFMTKVEIEGMESDDKTYVTMSIVADDFFDTMGMPILQGRAFTQADHSGDVQTVIVNETMARRFWPDQDPLGKRFRLGREEGFVKIVGIARDSKYITLGEAPRPYMYLPLSQRYRAEMTVFVRTAGDPEAFLPAFSEEVRALEPEMPMLSLHTVSGWIHRALWVPRMGVGLFSFFGALALVITALGIYGAVKSRNGSRRPHDRGAS